MKAKEIIETCIYGTELAAMEEFYGGILGLELVTKVAGSHIFFRCGNRMFLIFNPGATEKSGRPVPAHGSRGPGHVAFAMRNGELEAWQQHLQENGVPIEKLHDWEGGKARSLYFRDPAGNSVELISPLAWGIAEEAVFSSPG